MLSIVSFRLKSTIKIRHGISFGFLRDFGKGGAISSPPLRCDLNSPHAPKNL
ncbi:hypothetical protein MBAV_003667 [Candidatus Magnetobacterium bavaricum]|uniref:Uncharacterized protein n=1 Tax=Candidatus Magnetobacterium bavaricum TaxID=29290 RepID=A0A0F3GTV8_9BACT|nr:hypothetical protein MBAV_003667 [Candidatus Magnetobacterium bavaricum]